ncbi:MAG: DUF393 domain-containing protein [Myxococcales bacterium]|nr:DUF393 domain-containing protein [Myxococcales bacterium]
MPNRCTIDMYRHASKPAATGRSSPVSGISFSAMSVPRPERPLVLYDGHCGFCDASVQWLIAHDDARQFRFAALHGETARAIIQRHPLPPGLDSIIVVTAVGTADEAVRLHSAAIFSICQRLGFPWRAMSWCGWLPRPFTDLGYRVFARYRYLVWGRTETCRIPSEADRERFMA